MKIMTLSNSKIKSCYVQVRDFEYLGNLLQDGNYTKRYRVYKKNGKRDTDFVKVIDEKTLSLLAIDDLLVNFTDYRNSSILTISADIIAKMSSVFCEEDRYTASHDTDDLRDIMAFKKGELEYAIPVVPTDKIELVNGDMMFTSTVINDVYLLRVNGEVDEDSIKEYLVSCILLVYEFDYGDYVREELNYEIVKRNNGYIIEIKKGKRKNPLTLIKEKLKK